jgi:ribosomal protein S18 acetylase RimI-like enzyme
MRIRLGELTDLNTCLAIDDSFETEYVWQMEEQSGEGSITVSFRLSRLPRPMWVRGVTSQEELSRSLEADAVLIVAEDSSICGFIDASVPERSQLARINSLVVSPAYRRHGIGTELLRSACEWARERKARSVLVDISTKNYPAICFYQKHGFAFCGFNDKINPSRDISVSFASNPR